LTPCILLQRAWRPVTSFRKCIKLFVLFSVCS
jgi:hypothetical protein